MIAATPPQQQPDAEPVPIAGEPRPRLEPGEYIAVCTAARIERHRVFHRWTAVLKFSLVEPDGVRSGVSLPMYLNLGTGDVPDPTPSGRYYATWCVAAGHKPRRGERMDPAVFRDRQYRVRVTDVGAGPATYSKIASIAERLA